MPGVQPPVILLRSADHLTQGSAVGLARRESLRGVRRAEDGRAGIDPREVGCGYAYGPSALSTDPGAAAPVSA